MGRPPRLVEWMPQSEIRSVWSSFLFGDIVILIVRRLVVGRAWTFNPPPGRGHGDGRLGGTGEIIGR